MTNQLRSDELQVTVINRLEPALDMIADAVDGAFAEVGLA